LKVITTIGTSLIENLYRLITDGNFNIKNLDNQMCNNEEFKNLKRILENLKKDKDFKSKYNNDVLKKYNIKIKGKNISDYLKIFGIQCFPSASAELNSLYKLRYKLNKEGKANENLDIYLIVSDTNEGYFVGKILEEILKKLKKILKIDKVEFIHIPDLRVDDTKTFEKGINNLIDKIYTIIVKDENNKKVYDPEEVIFNITGGYKGVISYFSTIAQIFNYDIVYTFEDIEKENDLIEIKPLPIEIDRSMLDLFYPFLTNLEKLYIEEKKFLEEKGLLSNDNKLTPLGKILLLTSEKTIFENQTLGFIIEQLIYEYFVNIYFGYKNRDRECLDNFKFTKIKRGLFLGKGNTDIDIYLEDENNNFLWIESKPINYLLNNFYKLKNQILNKQIGKLNEFETLRNKSLKKYILILYTFSINDCENAFRFINKGNVNELIDLLKEQNIQLKICYFCLPLAKKDKNNKEITSKTFSNLLSKFEIDKLKDLQKLLEAK